MTTQEQIQELKDAGYRVYVKHLRTATFEEVTGATAYVLRKNGCTIWPRGGSTVVEIRKETFDSYHGKSIAKGVALCSDRDNFDKKRGLAIALGRAIKNLKEGEL